MITVSFQKSKSKYYADSEKLASNFDEHTFDGKTHTVIIQIKELFDKWDFFNLLFWKVVDWKGTTFGYDDYNCFSHSDKTRLFYALQWSHATWLNMSCDYLKLIAYAYYDEEYAAVAKMRTMIDYGLADFEHLTQKVVDVWK